MIILDHNIPDDQAEKLKSLRIHFRQIGHGVGRPEWDDQQEILRYLHREKAATFFTRDLGFFRPPHTSFNYCIVVLTGSVLEVASLIRRFMSHREFRAKRNRQGKIVKLSAERISWWEVREARQQTMSW